LIEKFSAAFPGVWLSDGYGSTETSSGDAFNDAAHILSKVGSVGRPVAHLEMRIVDDDGAVAPAGALGEVAVRGPKVFSGYWKDADATAAAFRDGWYMTGDVGYMDADGYLYIEDRKKDMIISGGENIASSEVERVLYEHPDVLEAAVVAVSHERWGEAPKAFIVPKADHRMDAEELRQFCGRHLAKFKVPREFVFLRELPRTSTGKVLKRALRTDAPS
jgi:acyl-CoA synthetase (AMP-forming)/AMP-acid ligase II